MDEMALLVVLAPSSSVGSPVSRPTDYHGRARVRNGRCAALSATWSLKALCRYASFAAPTPRRRCSGSTATSWARTHPLARSAGGDETLDLELVEAVWVQLSPMGGVHRADGSVRPRSKRGGRS